MGLAADRVPTKPDLLLRPVIRASLEAWSSEHDYRLGIEATLNSETSIYEINELTVTRHAAPVTSVGLKKIALREFFQNVVRTDVELESGDPYVEISEGMAHDMYVRGDPELDLHVARVYSVARAYGEPPLREVATRFGVSKSTATRMAARAREAGLLD